jgi:L-amino acid N-acyltransferase YncA
MSDLPVVNGLIVRASTEADVVRCAEIYAHHVLHGTASFEVDPPDLAEMKKRRGAVLDLGLPHLVAERAGHVLGYAYAGRIRSTSTRMPSGRVPAKRCCRC